MGYTFNEDGHVGGNIRHGDPACHAPQTWRWLIDRFAVLSMLDLGSGEGHAARFFWKHGVQAIAVDGSMSNICNAVYPTFYCDLTETALQTNVDLVWCQEVVEHVQETHIQNLMHALTSGPIVVMTHAEPGQKGYHHVNCQPSTYWIAKMAECGYAHLELDTERVRMLGSADSAHHLARSGLVFGRQDR